MYLNLKQSFIEYWQGQFLNLSVFVSFFNYQNLVYSRLLLSVKWFIIGAMNLENVSSMKILCNEDITSHNNYT